MSRTQKRRRASHTRCARRSLVELTAAASRAVDDGLFVLSSGIAASLARAQSLAGQFIFDVQTHFVRDDFDHKELLDLGEFASQHWNPKMKEEGDGSIHESTVVVNV